MVSNSKAVSVRDLEKRYGSFIAVDRITFEVEKGKIYGFIGPNGAGKSTTIRMLCGIIEPTSGAGQVAGYDILTESEEIKHAIGYMSQKFSLYEDLTPQENIRFYLGIYDVPSTLWQKRTEWALEVSRLQDVGRRITRELPPGWRQRLALSCALLHDPHILFLDEPTSGVDPLTRRHFWQFIRQLAARGVTCFVTTHYMEEARNCDCVLMINDGRIVAEGAPSSILEAVFPGSSHATLNDVFIELMARGKH
jgi:ABC-2 type transport system ATP-binding protein